MVKANKNSYASRSSKASQSLRVRRCGSKALLRVQLPHTEQSLEGLIASNADSLSNSSDYSFSDYVGNRCPVTGVQIQNQDQNSSEIKHESGSITSSPASSISTDCNDNVRTEQTADKAIVSKSLRAIYGRGLAENDSSDAVTSAKYRDNFTYPSLSLTPLALSMNSLSFSF